MDEISINYPESILIRNLLLILLLMTVGFLISCDKTDGVVNPEPSLKSCYPEKSIIHHRSFLLTLNGTDFVRDSKVYFNNIEKDTIYTSSVQLLANIDPDDTIPEELQMKLKYSKLTNYRLPIKVYNPPPGGGNSNVIDFPVTTLFRMSAPEELTGSVGNASKPSIAKAGANNLFIVYTEEISPVQSSIMMVQSLNNGRNFNDPVEISTEYSNADNPQVIVNGQYLHTVWDADINSNKEIICATSDDLGNTFETKVVSNNSGDSTRPRVAVDGEGILYIVWHDSTSSQNTEILISTSDDKGSSFSEPISITNNNKASLFPSINFDNEGNILVAWYQNEGDVYDIYFSKSTDKGISFSTPINVSSNNSNSRYPCLDVDSNNTIYIVWHDDATETDTVNRIYISKSVNGGASFSTPKVLTPAEYSSERPVLIIDQSDALNIFYKNNSVGIFNTYMTRSVDEGESILDPQNLLSNKSSQFISALIDSNSYKYVVWSSNISDDGYIYFTMSYE